MGGSSRWAAQHRPHLPALPTLADDLDAGPSSAQLTLTGVLVRLGLGQLLIGPLVDIYGRSSPLLIRISAHVVASLLCAGAPTIEILDALRVLQGAGAAAASVVAMAVGRDLFRDLFTMLRRQSGALDSVTF